MHMLTVGVCLKILPHTDLQGNVHRILVLRENDIEHQLSSVFSEEELEWLVPEIREVVEGTRSHRLDP